MAALITLDTQKQQNGVSEAFNIQELFNARVGDEQVPFSVKFLERGKAQQFEDGLVPFMSGFVGNLDDDGKVTAETGEPVSYTGSRDDIVGLGMVKMNLPGMMFPQEGYFYGFLGLETPDHSKRVSTFSVWFHVYNGNPDMFVNKEPFRSELQKELDYAELLIKQVDEDGKAKLKELEDMVNDLITDKNIDLGLLESRMSTAEGNLKILEEKIKADGLVTLDQLDSILDGFKLKLDAIPIVDSKMDIGGELTPEMKSIADDFVSALPKDGFKFLMITDSHYEDTAFPLPSLGYPHGKESLWHLSIVDYLANYVDVVVAGGDNTNGMTWDYTHTVADQDLFATKLLDTPGTADKFLLKGNHDDGSPIMRYGTTMPDGTSKMGSALPSDVMTDEDFKRVFRTREQLFNEQRQDGDSLYFYKDYPDSKIRLIGLDSFDVPIDTVNNDGTLKHMRYITTSFSNKQLNWLISEALMNVPEDYQVIITTHCPQVGGDIAEDPESTWFNHELLQGILDSFVDGTSYTGQSPAETPKEMFAKVSTNFTGQGPRVIAGYYVGHYHTERIEKLDNFTEVLFLNDVNGDQTQSAESFSVNSMGISVATINTAKRSVQINGLGRATNRSYTY